MVAQADSHFRDLNSNPWYLKKDFAGLLSMTPLIERDKHPGELDNMKRVGFHRPSFVQYLCGPFTKIDRNR